VVDDLTLFDHLSRPPWNARWLQGHLDAPYLELTPGTRAGVIHDSAYTTFCEALAPLEQKLIEIIEAQCRAEEEQASREQLRTIQRAFREALLALPAEEYDWFDIGAHRAQRAPQRGEDGNVAAASDAFDDATTPALGAPEPTEDRQRQFFSLPGPLFSVAISPASSVARVGAAREPRALPRDRSRRRVEDELEFHWEIIEGLGVLAEVRSQTVTYFARRARTCLRQGHGSPARRHVRERGLDHRDERTARANQSGDYAGAGPARLHVRARARRILAI
jgi:hypothetical protein